MYARIILRSFYDKVVAGRSFFINQFTGLISKLIKSNAVKGNLGIWKTRYCI